MENVNLKLVIAVSRSFHQLFNKIEKNVQSFGLNISEFGVLEMLYHKGDQPVQKIAEKILVTSGTITYVINKLQKKDLVVRKKCETDGRIYYISLTKKGENLISDIFPKHEAFLDNLFKDLKQQEKENLLENLKNFTNNI
jgi:MarR family 2-MHQ and catechol resistance regulon transcriptional repressor